MVAMKAPGTPHPGLVRRAALALLALAPLLAQAAPSTLPSIPPAPAGAASPATLAASGAASAAPLRLKPPPRLLSTTEKLESAAAPGTVRPERPALPQISIPLGRRATSDDTPPRLTPMRRPEAAMPASAAVDETAARCEARAAKADRAACRAAPPASAARPRP